MYSQSFTAIFSAVRALLRNRRALLLMIAAYAGLLFAIYLFVSTREATIFQLILTLVAVAGAPALFFALQAVSVSYTSSTSRGLIQKTLKLIAVSFPVLALTLLAMYGLNKVQLTPQSSQQSVIYCWRSSLPCWRFNSGSPPAVLLCVIL